MTTFAPLDVTTADTVTNLADALHAVSDVRVGELVRLLASDVSVQVAPFNFAVALLAACRASRPDLHVADVALGVAS